MGDVEISQQVLSLKNHLAEARGLYRQLGTSIIPMVELDKAISELDVMLRALHKIEAQVASSEEKTFELLEGGLTSFSNTLEQLRPTLLDILNHQRSLDAVSRAQTLHKDLTIGHRQLEKWLIWSKSYVNHL